MLIIDFLIIWDEKFKYEEIKNLVEIVHGLDPGKDKLDGKGRGTGWFNCEFGILHDRVVKFLNLFVSDRRLVIVQQHVKHLLRVR